jgi:IS30 family transposase
MKYKRISLEDRIEIYHLLDQGKSLRKIAKEINRSISSISEEIRKG